MTTREERLNALMNAGINTDDFISVMIPKNLKENQRIVLSVKDGKIDAALDEVEEKIKRDGYTACTKLYRRWICAQMLRILTEIENTGSNFNKYARLHYGMKYRFHTVEHECEVLAKLQKEDPESFSERKVFFSPNVIENIYYEYGMALIRAWNVEKEHKCKGKQYKHIGHKNMFIDDFSYTMQKYGMFRGMICNMDDYAKLSEIVHKLNNIIFDIDFDTSDGIKQWIEAFKGNGAYYTLKNLVLFHDCVITNYDDGHLMKGEEAFKWMQSKLNVYEGYQWLALLEKCVKTNNVTINNLY